jgi:gliding motility-associated-like protein
MALLPQQRFKKTRGIAFATLLYCITAICCSAAASTLKHNPNVSVVQPSITSFSPATGAAGTLVTITGTNFSTLTSVTFGSNKIPALIISKSATSIVASVESGTALGKTSVIINIDGGGSATSTSLFTVIETAFPKYQAGKLIADLKSLTINSKTFIQQGAHVALSGDGNTAIVSNYLNFGSDAGLTFYKRVNGEWLQDSKMLSIYNSRLFRATSVAISSDGNTAVVGGVASFSVSDAKAYVFTRKNNVWSDPMLLPHLGQSVTISGDGNYIATGLVNNQYVGTDSVNLYTRNGDVWTSLPNLPAHTDVGPGYGVSISTDGKTLVVKAKSRNIDIGYTAVYTRPATGSQAWEFLQDFNVSDLVSISGDGSKLAIRRNGSNATNLYQRLPGKAFTSIGIIRDAFVAFTADGSTAASVGPTTGYTALRFNPSTSRYETALQLPGLKGTNIALSGDGTVGFLGNPNDPTYESKDEGEGGTKYVGGSYGLISDYPPPPVIEYVTPATPATALTFSNATLNSATLSWKSGSGAARLVFIQLGTAGVPSPPNGTTYNDNPVFGQGGITGAGWYCVYNGTGSSVNISGLASSSIYSAAVIEFNGDGTGRKYLLTGTTAKVTTLIPERIQASNLTFTNTTGTTATVNWQGGNGSGRAVFIANSTTGAPAPANVYYSANTRFRSGNQIGTSGWYCIYNGTGSTVNIIGLTSGQNYRVAAVEYDGTLASPQYILKDIVPASMATPIEAPSGYATGLAFSNTAATATTLSWVNSNGAARAVFLRLGVSGALNVVQGATYSGNSNFGAGSAVGTNGWYCVYNGTGNNVNITGLTATSTYRAIVIEYNGTTGSELYNLTRYNAANVLTTAAPSLLLTTNQKQRIMVSEPLKSDITEVNIHQGVSPNGDGVNDVFTIDGIDAYPQNTVQILNSNGEAIYSVTGYDNYSKAFDGHSTNGALQKAGTYFYTLEYKKGAEVIRKTGYLVIKF